jgi:hypothetical protein
MKSCKKAIVGHDKQDARDGEKESVILRLSFKAVV